MNIELTFDRRPSALAYMLRGVLPSRHRARDVPSLTASWRGMRVEPRELSDFARLTGLDAGATLSVVHPLAFGFRLPMAILTHPSFPVPIWRVLQTRNHVLAHRAVPIGSSMELATRVASSRVLDRGLEFDLHTTLHVEGALAWESLVTFLARGRHGEPAAPSPLAVGPSLAVALGAADTRAVAWHMPDDGHLRFGAFTGDYNGIHLSDRYARAFGFRRALYHPSRVLGQIMARLPEPTAVPASGDRRRLDVWLKAPVFRGAAVRLHTHATDGETTFALVAEGARPSVVGRLARVAAGAKLVDGDGAPSPARRPAEGAPESSVPCGDEARAETT